MDQSIQQVSEDYGGVRRKDAEIFRKSQKTSVSDEKIGKFAFPGYCKKARSFVAPVCAPVVVHVSLHFDFPIFITGHGIGSFAWATTERRRASSRRAGEPEVLENDGRGG